MISKVIAVLACVSAARASSLRDIPEDARLNFTGLAMKYLGRVEEHDVTTADGYVLKLHRVAGDPARPVHVMHGLMGSSGEYLVLGRDSHVFALAAAGYDVWLGNFRGNRYSRRHVSLNPDGPTKAQFWRFGPHQHGTGDLAAFIDFILNATGQSRLSLIGHSEGTLITYILASERPEYNDKVKIFIALAPVMNFEYIAKKLPPLLLKAAHTLIKVTQTLGIEELGEFDGILGTILRKICGQTLVGRQLCRQFLLNLLGYDAEGLPTEYMSTLVWHYPAGSSRMNLEHALQMIDSGRFANYDYGPAANLVKYGSRLPRAYDRKRVTMRTHILASRNDRLAVPADTARQARELPGVVRYTVLDDAFYNHADFVWTPRSKEIQPLILDILHKYNED